MLLVLYFVIFIIHHARMPAQLAERGNHLIERRAFDNKWRYARPDQQIESPFDEFLLKAEIGIFFSSVSVLRSSRCSPLENVHIGARTINIIEIIFHI